MHAAVVGCAERQHARELADAVAPDVRAHDEPTHAVSDHDRRRCMGRREHRVDLPPRAGRRTPRSTRAEVRRTGCRSLRPHAASGWPASGSRPRHCRARHAAARPERRRAPARDRERASGTASSAAPHRRALGIPVRSGAASRAGRCARHEGDALETPRRSRNTAGTAPARCRSRPPEARVPTAPTNFRPPRRARQ